MRGRPFQKGEDDRRNLNGRGPSLPKSIRQQAREDRDNTFRSLAALRDQRKDLRIALEASKVLAEYCEGKPGPAAEGVDAAVSEDDQREAAFDALVPPGWSWEERAALRERLGLPEEIDVRPPALDDLEPPSLDDFPGVPSVRSSQ